jgi:hypothetical protein
LSDQADKFFMNVYLYDCDCHGTHMDRTWLSRHTTSGGCESAPIRCSSLSQTEHEFTTEIGGASGKKGVGGGGDDDDDDGDDKRSNADLIISMFCLYLYAIHGGNYNRGSE